MLFDIEYLAWKTLLDYDGEQKLKTIFSLNARKVFRMRDILKYFGQIREFITDSYQSCALVLVMKLCPGTMPN